LTRRYRAWVIDITASHGSVGHKTLMSAVGSILKDSLGRGTYARASSRPQDPRSSPPAKAPPAVWATINSVAVGLNVSELALIV